MDLYRTLNYIANLHAPMPSRAVVENPAVDTVLEHLLVFEVLASETSPAEKRDHARRIVDAVLAMNGAKVIR